MTRKRRKVIFLWTYVDWGGAQIYLLPIMKEAMREYDVLVALPRSSSPQIIGFLEQIGVQLELLDFHLDSKPALTVKRRIQRRLNRIATEIRAFRWLNRFDLSECILHLEISAWQSWQFLTLLSLRKANVFVSMHNALPNVPRWRVLLWKARLHFVSRLPGFHIILSNQDTKNKLKGWVEDVFWNKIKIVYTGIDPSQISAASGAQLDKPRVLKDHGIPSSKCIVLCVAQFIDRKGRWIFLDAAKIIATNSPDFTFVWVTPEMPNDIEQAVIDSYNLGDRFQLILSDTIGTSRIEILKFFRIADIFVLASFVEGLPGALLEAMAMGLPCISTKVNAIPEAINNLETGIIIEPGEPAKLAHEINLLAENPEFRLSIAEAGKRFVLNNFDQNIASRIAINEYHKCFRESSRK
ncbi:glycosyltransferase [soil metagenome]